MENHHSLLLALATTLLVAPALAGPAGAAHSWECGDWIQYVPPDARETTYPVYVTIDELMTGYLFSVWIYAESNGERGLQRDDDYCYTTNADGQAHTSETADTIIF